MNQYIRFNIGYFFCAILSTNQRTYSNKNFDCSLLCVIFF